MSDHPETDEDSLLQYGVDLETYWRLRRELREGSPRVRKIQAEFAGVLEDAANGNPEPLRAWYRAAYGKGAER